MTSHNKLSKSPAQLAVQYTFIITIFYALSKYFDLASPKGTAFISYIIPILLSDILLIVFPLLFVFFYLKETNSVQDIQKNIFKNNNECDLDAKDTREILRDYHNMLKEGIITQEEFDTIKKRYFNQKSDSKK